MNTSSTDNEVPQEVTTESTPSASNNQTDKALVDQTPLASTDIPLSKPEFAQKYMGYFFSSGLIGSLSIFLIGVIFSFEMKVIGVYLLYIWLTSLVSVAFLRKMSSWWLIPISYSFDGTARKVSRVDKGHIVVLLAVSSYLSTVILLYVANGKVSISDTFINSFSSNTLLINFVMWIFNCAMFFGISPFLHYLGRRSKLSLYLANNYFFSSDYEDTSEINANFLRADESLLDKLYYTSALTNTRSTAIQLLHIRARKLRFLNSLILLFVVFVLTSAAFFVVFAGQIASKDASSLDSMQNIRNLIDAQEEALLKLEQEQAERESKIVLLKAVVEKKDNIDAKEISRANSELAAENAKKDYLNKRIFRVTASVEKFTTLIDKMETSAVNDKADATNPITANKLLVAAGVTRFGVLVIVIYLVQILVGLYRYNAKLMTFYLGQSDALILLGESADEIGNMADRLSPRFDFGKTDATLLEKVLEKVESVVKSAQTKGTDQKE